MRCPTCQRPMFVDTGGEWACRGCDAPVRRRVGEQSFVFVFVVGIVTLGIYYLIYRYRAFGEVHREQGIRHPTGWFWLNIVGWIASTAILLVVYRPWQAPLPQEMRESPIDLVVDVISIAALLANAIYITSCLDAVRSKVEQAPGPAWPFAIALGSAIAGHVEGAIGVAGGVAVTAANILMWYRIVGALHAYWRAVDGGDRLGFSPPALPTPTQAPRL